MAEPNKVRYWSRLAHDYDAGATYVVGDAIQKAILAKLSGESDLGETIEFGCGAGYFTRAIAPNAELVVATDLSEDMLEAARTQLRGFRNVTIQKADCERASFPSGSFDTVFMANVVHFIEDPVKALQEGYRILRDGGLLLLVDYTGYQMRWFDKMGLAIRFVRKCGRPPRYAQFSLAPDELGSLVERAGFTLQSVQLIGERAKALYLKARKEAETAQKVPGRQAETP